MEFLLQLYQEGGGYTQLPVVWPHLPNPWTCRAWLASIVRTQYEEPLTLNCWVQAVSFQTDAVD
jgi:hypothetical protein